MPTTSPILDREDAQWDEPRRSAALHAYDVLDTPRERDFDDIALIAAEVCGTPIAVVNLVDTRRQFFKAEVGLGVRETPLETSFCGHAILADELMIVADATKDPRFDCNPLVTGAPHLRFYAGALLKSPEGWPIGTICVLDYVPRELDERQVRILRFLARQAMTQLELRKTLAAQRRDFAKARRAERETATLALIVEQSTDFIGLADTQGRVYFLNDAARQMVGLAPHEVQGTSVVDYFAFHERETVLAEVIPAVVERGSWQGELHFQNFANGTLIPVLYSIFPLHDEEGGLVGYGTVTRDITRQRLELQRRNDLMREIAHRMKNSLAMVQAIVSQTFRTAKTIEEGREAISGRLMALANAQNILTATDSASAPILDVVTSALAPHRTGEGRFSLSGPDFDVTSQQALGLALALHELATNAAKYGALTTPDGRIDVRWNVSGSGRFNFEWNESGGPAVQAPTQSGFGTRLVERVVAPYFAGTAKLTFGASGVRFRLDGSLTPSGNEEEASLPV